MKKLLILLTFIFAFGIVQSQIGRYPYSKGIAEAGGSSWPVTDDFNSYEAASSLAGQGNWAQEENAMRCTGTAISSYVSGDESCIFYNVAINANQYASIDCSGTNSDQIGIAVRIGGGAEGDYYAYVSKQNFRYLYRVDNGSPTTLGSVYDNTPTISMKLSASGSTISCYIDKGEGWVLDSDLSNTADGTFSDATYGTGYVGVAGYGNAVQRLGDNWEGGEL